MRDLSSWSAEISLQWRAGLADYELLSGCAKEGGMGQMEEGRLSAGARFPERRTAARFAFDAQMSLIDPVEQNQLTGRVTVLSEKGCFARMQTPMAHRAVVQVQIQKDGSVFGTWARATPNHPEAETGVVLVFIDTPPEEAKVLAGWLNALAAERLAARS